MPAIASQPPRIRFNSVPQPNQEIHYVYMIDEMYVARVRSGTVFTFLQFDSNCRAIMNCGTVAGNYNMSNAVCRQNARSVTGITLPITKHNALVTDVKDVALAGEERHVGLEAGADCLAHASSESLQLENFPPAEPGR